VTETLEAVGLRDGLRRILAVGNRGNKLFQDMKPWETLKTDPDHALATVSVLTYLIRSLAIALEPYMPDTSRRILGFLNLENQSWQDVGVFEGLDGHQINLPEILYPKLDMKQAEKLRKKFSGEAPEFGRFRIVVGQIRALEPISETNYHLTVDLGADGSRKIVGNLAKTYAAADLLDRKVLVLANLAPAEIGGHRSEGMLLAADKKKKLELLDGSSFAVGEVVVVDDQKVAHAEIGIEVFKQAPFKLKDKQVLFDDQVCRIGERPIGTVDLVNGKIR